MVGRLLSPTVYITSTPVRYSDFTKLNDDEEDIVRKFVIDYHNDLPIQAHDPGESECVKPGCS